MKLPEVLLKVRVYHVAIWLLSKYEWWSRSSFFTEIIQHKNDLKPKPYVTLTMLAMASKMYYMFWEIVYYVISRIVLDIVIVKTKHLIFL